MYIVVTEVDAVTKIPCTVEPQRTGPSLPEVKGLQFKWADESSWPVELDSTGKYLRAPKYYCTCDDDANVDTPGVLGVLTEEVWNERKSAELEARRPYPSWISYLDTMTWGPPVPIPADSLVTGGNVNYEWNEETLSWISQVTSE